MSDREELAVAEALQQLRGDRGFIDRVATPIFTHIKGRLPPWPNLYSYDPRGRTENNQDVANSQAQFNGKESFNSTHTTLPPIVQATGMGPNGVIMSPSPPAADLAHTVLSPRHASPAPLTAPAAFPVPVPIQMQGPNQPIPMSVTGPVFHQGVPGVPVGSFPGAPLPPMYTSHMMPEQQTNSAGISPTPQPPFHPGGFHQQSPGQGEQIPPPPQPLQPPLHQNGAGAPGALGGWRGMFLTATSLVITEDSRRRLRCSLKLLKLANQNLSEKIDALRRAVDADAQAEGLTPKISAEALRQDIVATVRKSVTVITTFMSSALPESARCLVRNAILAMPARWATRAGSSGVSESAALSLAVEALETIRNVTDIVSSVLDRADAWCKGVGKRSRDEVEDIDTDYENAAADLNRGEAGTIFNDSIPGLVRHLSNESSQSIGADSIATQPDVVLRHTRKASRND